MSRLFAPRPVAVTIRVLRPLYELVYLEAQRRLDDRPVQIPQYCEFLQCTVLGKHGAVSDDVTLRGRDVIFFLKQAPISSHVVATSLACPDRA